MPVCGPKGNPSSRLWVICDTPLPRDQDKGYVFSGGLGYVFEKMLKESGLPDPYYIARRPNTDDPKITQPIENNLNAYKPPIVIALDASGSYMLKELEALGGAKSYKTQLGKYIGSLLESPKLNYPHYMIPLFGPEKAVQSWTERTIMTYFDMQKIRVELEYIKAHGVLQPKTFRDMHFNDMSLDEVLMYLTRFESAPLLSNDIETCYPKKDSDFYPHPGYPILVGLADSPNFAVSFDLFRDSMAETKVLWRKLDPIIHEIPQLGQNFFNFDSKFYNMLGFRIDMNKIKDTMLRHHVLWPELPHKLQFQTRQYTREPYYKDEGHGWNLKNKAQFRRYNCLDVCVTYEIYFQQEEEFKGRPYLA